MCVGRASGNMMRDRGVHMRRMYVPPPSVGIVFPLMVCPVGIRSFLISLLCPRFFCIDLDLLLHSSQFACEFNCVEPWGHAWSPLPTADSLMCRCAASTTLSSYAYSFAPPPHLLFLCSVSHSVLLSVLLSL